MSGVFQIVVKQVKGMHTKFYSLNKIILRPEKPEMYSLLIMGFTLFTTTLQQGILQYSLTA
jgi:uncharacterized membrane protein